VRSHPLEPVFVVRVDPEDGSSGVFCDALVLARLSHRLDPRSVSRETFRVEDERGEVPSRLELSPDGLVVFCHPSRPLTPGVEHVIVASGLKDHRGREVAVHRSRFVPCGLTRDDLGP
jgi:hypothetical protein